MAGHTYRGTAFSQLVQALLRGKYYKGLGGEEYQKILGQLTEAQMPFFEETMRDYWSRLGAEGQAVPGQGVSTAGQLGFGDLTSQFAAQMATQALGAYQMPWQSAFGKGPESTQTMTAMATKMGQQTQAMPDIQCCFIFVEANNGILDRIARRYRDEHGTKEQAIGYKLLSIWLVPLMRKHRSINLFVKWIMIKPMIWWGKAFYGENLLGHIFWPFKYFWLGVFDAIGRNHIKEIKREILNDYYNKSS